MAADRLQTKVSLAKRQWLKSMAQGREDVVSLDSSVVLVSEVWEISGVLKTFLGAVEDESEFVYLRPETVQGIFINFENVATSSRKNPPFGISQIEKSFRYTITPGSFIFRTRKYEQMEMEFFVIPGSDEEWHQTRWTLVATIMGVLIMWAVVGGGE